jgi:uncharacterized protein
MIPFLMVGENNYLYNASGDLKDNGMSTNHAGNPGNNQNLSFKNAVSNRTSSSVKRQTAIKSWISDIANGRYIKVDGEWEPNYVLTTRNIKVSRANIIGVVISDPDIDPGHYSFVVDDGSSKITVRSFDSPQLSKKITQGDVVYVIGRPREFGSEIYVMPEIINKVKNNAWLNHRKIELDIIYENMPAVFEQSNNQPARQNYATNSVSNLGPKKMDDIGTLGRVSAVTEERVMEESPAEQTAKKNPIELVLSLIRKFDTGNGADIEAAISESKLDRAKADAIINNLLMDGEIFEIKPGKLKVME